MLAKDILSRFSADWVIGNPRSTFRAGAVKERKLERHSTITVKIQSTEYYELDDWKGWQQLPGSFSKAASSSKSKGFLVFSPADQMYRVVPAKLFMETLIEMEKIWADSERRANERQAKEARLQQIRTEALTEAELRNTTLRESLSASLTKVLGKVDDVTHVEVRSTGEWDNTDAETPQYLMTQRGSVVLSARDFQRLLEKLYEAQDALA